MYVHAYVLCKHFILPFIIPWIVFPIYLIIMNNIFIRLSCNAMPKVTQKKGAISDSKQPHKFRRTKSYRTNLFLKYRNNGCGFKILFSQV